MFRDRDGAGRRLAGKLLPLAGDAPIVLALPRGGVPVAAPVAEALQAPLDVLLVRKIGAPLDPELGLGAVVEGRPPTSVLDPRLIALLDVDPGYLALEQRRQLAEIQRQADLYRPGLGPPDIAGRTVIVVDDGIATGGTMRAALEALRLRRPRKLVVAVPVATAEALETLKDEADTVVCLETPEAFRSVGGAYEDFAQVPDSEVVAALRRLRPACGGR